MRDADVGSSSDASAEGRSLVRHEEELQLGKTSERLGAVRARKRVETTRGEQVVPRSVEHVDEVDRVPVENGDSGEIETLPDGSVSIPILEEELVVTKRIVVRERVIVRKRTETEQRRVVAELRRERIELEADERVDVDTDDAA